MKIKKYFGPSTLVAAAFVGPGTLTICTISGVQYGYSMLWVLLFATIATVVFQEHSARVGLITQRGLGEQIRRDKSKGLLGLMMFSLVLMAIFVGNSAYQAGNLGGALLGADLIFEQSNFTLFAITGLAMVVLWQNNFKLIQQVLIGMVVVISLVFLITAVALQPNLKEILTGLIPSQFDWLHIIALVGTTIVPYNLFLHASTIQNKYIASEDLTDLRIETWVSIGLGGFISMLIVIVATSAESSGVGSAADMAVQLKPLLGGWADIVMGVGLLAAGLSSAITAPYAAALALREMFQWTSTWAFRFVWLTVLLVGFTFNWLQYKPIVLIQFAQITNGLLLPILAFYLLYLGNQKQLLGKNSNGLFRNLVMLLVCGLCLLISFKVMLGFLA